jgi:hypothetical protein
MLGNRGTSLLAIGLALNIGYATRANAQAPAADDAAPFDMRLDAYFADPADVGVYRALAGLGDPIPQPHDEWLNAFDAGSDGEDLAKQLGIGLGYEAGDCRLEHALTILKARIAAFGSDAPYVLQWVKAEQAVLAACRRDDGHDGAASGLPPPMEIRDPALARLQRQDRAYQEAVLLFYEGSFDAAARAFDRIAVATSPDRPFARYMALAIRAGSQPDRSSYKPLEPVSVSLAQANRLLEDPAARSVQPYVYDLIGWIGAHSGRMDASRAQVGRLLDALKASSNAVRTDRETRRRYEDARADSERVFSGFDDEAALFDGQVPEDHTGSRAMAEAASRDPLATWLVFPISPYQHNDWALVQPAKGQTRLQAEIERRAPSRFDPTSPWSHLALMWNTSRYDPALWPTIDAEIARSQAAPKDGALAATALDFYHQVRAAVMYAPPGLASESALDQAIHQLKAFPSKSTASYEAAVQESLRYLMLSGRLEDARRLRDALDLAGTAQATLANTGADAYRQQSIIGLLRLLAEDEGHLVAAMSDSGDALLNRLSIDELYRLARRTDTPKAARAMFARTAWARTYALGRPVAPALDALMRQENPETTAHWSPSPGRPIGPNNHDTLADVLATPALNTVIDSINRSGARVDPPRVGIDRNKRNDDNWWGPWSVKANDEALSAYLSEAFDSGDRGDSWDPLTDPGVRRVLDASFAMRHADPAEIEALTHIESAPQLLTERTIAWVNGTGLFQSRKGQSEALAAAVLTTRWGVDWAGHHGAYSRAAFDLLHERFPSSGAARRTRYWYDCNGFCQDRSDDLPPAPPVTLSRPPAGLLGLIDRLLHPKGRSPAPIAGRKGREAKP